MYLSWWKLPQLLSSRCSFSLLKDAAVLGATLSWKQKLCGLLKREGQEEELSLKTLTHQVSGYQEGAAAVRQGLHI